MSFNWPEIPFTGAEVEAFVDAYKELAEEIYTDYINGDVNIGVLKLPYRGSDNIKTFLTYGLLYAAFIVKQRANNYGPGADFILGNSPYTPPLTDEQKDEIIRNLGCIADNDQMRNSYRENTGKNVPKGGREIPDYLDPFIPSGPGDEDNPQDDCTDLLSKLSEVNTNYNNNLYDDKEDSIPSGQMTIEAITRIFAAFTDTVARVFAPFRGSYGIALQYRFAAMYIFGNAPSVVTKQWLDSYVGVFISLWLREDTAYHMNLTGTKITVPASVTCSGSTISVSQNTRNAYGMGPNDMIYVVAGENNYIFKNIFGGFTVITNGDELNENAFQCSNGKVVLLRSSLSFTPSNIKQIRDDYDFDYGFEVARSDETGDAGDGVAGDEITDDQIRSGVYRNNNRTSACEASTGDPNSKDGTRPAKNRSKFEPNKFLQELALYVAGLSNNEKLLEAAEQNFGTIMRFLVANNHGNAYYQVGQYQRGPNIGRPFPINIQY